MKELPLLTGIRLRMLVNSFRNPTRELIYKSLFFLIIGILFVVGDYSFFYKVIYYLKGEEIIGPILITQLLDMMALTLFFMLFFSTVVAAISTMYLSSELDLMISLPISISSVFIIKFVQTILNSSCMVVIFALPMFCALGGVYRLDLSYYIYMILLLFPFIVIPAGLGILFTVSLIRYFPAKRMQQVMTFIILLFLSGLVVFVRFLKPETLYRKVDMGDNMIMAFFEKMSVPRSPWFPSAWLTDGIMYLAEGVGQDVFMPLMLLYLAALLVFAVALLVARFFYFAGLSEASTTSLRGGIRKDKVEFFFSLFPLPIHTRALLVKDAKIFFRDTGQWSQMFILGALVVVYIFNIKNLPLDSYYLKNLVAFLNLGLAGFVLASVAIRFVFPSVSLEGGAIWVIKRSPIKMRSFIWEKYFAFLIPLLILGELLMVASNLLLGVDSFMMVLSVVSIFLLTLGITGLGVGMGAIYPRFRYENVAQVAAGTGGIIYMILCLAYISAVIMLEARPVYVHFKKQLFIGDYSMTSLYLAALFIIIMTASAIFFPMQKGIKALEEMDV